MKKFLIILIILSSSCTIIKIQNITLHHCKDVKVDGTVKGSDPTDSLNGNKGELEIPLAP